jgi:hypothetical protein
MNRRLVVISVFVAVAAGARLLPHPPNVTPIVAIALFGGACLRNKKLAFLLPLAAMLLSDLALGFAIYGGNILRWSQLVVYACIAAIAGIGFLLQDRRSVARVVSAGLASSILFFIVTNFAVWAGDSLYPKNWSGLVTCYTAAIPFFRNSILGDAFFGVLLFGGFALLENRVRSLREHPDPHLIRA